MADWQISRLADWQISRLGDWHISRLGDWEISRLRETIKKNLFLFLVQGIGRLLYEVISRSGDQ